MVSNCCLPFKFNFNFKFQSVILAFLHCLIIILLQDFSSSPIQDPVDQYLFLCKARSERFTSSARPVCFGNGCSNAAWASDSLAPLQRCFLLQTTCDKTNQHSRILKRSRSCIRWRGLAHSRGIQGTGFRVCKRSLDLENKSRCRNQSINSN